MSLRYLFVDMNSYFTSVEQQERPELRGRPVAVVPVRADTTSCIAASYEAKRYGVRTGTPVHEARRLCPDLVLVESRPRLYVQTHHRIVAAVDSCVPVAAVMSIDEMVCKLEGPERQLDGARRLAGRIKESILEQAGPALRCSIGIAPNRWLAKVAADMQKPDGLTTIKAADLPDRLHALKLTDFPGIGPRMERRLLRAGVTDVPRLCALTAAQLADVWGSKLLGAAWWHQLRGADVPERPTRHRTLGHSRVLPPDQRGGDAAWPVLVRLVHKAAARLRHEGSWAGSVTVEAKLLGGGRWYERRRIDQCQDTLTLIREVRSLWERRPGGRLLKIGVVFGDLQHERNRTPSLFEPERKALDLARAMDRVNRRFGLHGAYFAGMHGLAHQYTTRIAFNRVPDLNLDDA